MDEEIHFGRNGDDDGLVMVDINTILRGKDVNCNLLPNRDQESMKREPPEVILDSSCEEVDIKDEQSIKLYEDIGYNIKIQDIRSELNKEIFDSESSVEMDTEDEIIEEEDDFIQETLVESPINESIDTCQETLEIKRELQESRIKRAIGQDQKTASFIEEEYEKRHESQSISVPIKKISSSAQDSNICQDDANSHSCDQSSFSSVEQQPPFKKIKLKKSNKRPEIPSSSILKDSSNQLNSVSKTKDVAFNYGDLVWAKMKGYPDWPGIIVKEPKSQQFHRVKKLNRKKRGKCLENQFYILFLDYNDEVAWVDESCISKYKMHFSKKRTKVTVKAMAIADDLFEMSSEERLRRYAEIQDENKDLKNELYRKKYPKLFMEPIVRVQMLETTLFKSPS